MKTKRFLGVLLTLVMVIGIVPITASAVSSNILYGSSLNSITTAGNLSEIISSQSGTIYIKLTDNVTVSESITVDGKDIYLDLAGFTMTSSASSSAILLRNGGSLTMSDSSSGKTGLVSSEDQGCFFQVANNSTLTFNSGNYKTDSTLIVRLGSTATAIVNGGTFETTASNGIAFTVEGMNATLNIHGGRFKAYSADKPNIRYRYGKINITDFDPTDGILCISPQNSSTEAVAISSFVTLGSDGLMITDTEGR